MIGIVAAQGEELAALRKRLRAAERRTVGGLEARRGRLGERDVVLLVTGEGVRLAAAGVEALLDEDPSVEAILGIGVAGALTSDLAVGDLLVGRRVLAPEGDEMEPPDWHWSRSREGSSLGAGTLVTVERIAQAAEEKRRLATLHRLVDSAAVDLESSAWARAAAARGRPWLIVRSMSDTVDEDLPLDFERFRDAGGAISRARIVAHVVARPRLVPALDRLRRRLRTCAARLADAAEELLAC